MKRKLFALTILAVALPAVFFILAGCMKKPEHKPDYGPSVSPQEVQSAIDELLVADPETLKTGEYANYTVYQQLGSGSIQVAGQIAWTVTSRVDAGDRWKYHIVQHVEDRSTEPPTETDHDIEVELMKSTAALSVVSPFKLVTASEKVSLWLNKMGTFKHVSTLAEPDKSISYHNLTRENGFFAIPSAVKKLPNCGGLARCDQDLRTMTLGFDEVVWTSEDRGDRVSYKITVSPDVPYLAYKLRTCEQAFYPRNGAEIGLTICREATSFEFGHE